MNFAIRTLRLGDERVHGTDYFDTLCVLNMYGTAETHSAIEAAFNELYLIGEGYYQPRPIKEFWKE